MCCSRFFPNKTPFSCQKKILLSDGLNLKRRTVINFSVLFVRTSLRAINSVHHLTTFWLGLVLVGQSLGVKGCDVGCEVMGWYLLCIPRIVIGGFRAIGSWLRILIINKLLHSWVGDSLREDPWGFAHG